MVSCGGGGGDRATAPTTTCVVQKEQTQTRITFDNLSTQLTVDDLYKYVQLHLDEDRPFELTLVRDHQLECFATEQQKHQKQQKPLKIPLGDKKKSTLLAAGLNFENGAANTVFLVSAPLAPGVGAGGGCGNSHVKQQPQEANGKESEGPTKEKGETGKPLKREEIKSLEKPSSNSTATLRQKTNGHIVESKEEVEEEHQHQRDDKPPSNGIEMGVPTEKITNGVETVTMKLPPSSRRASTSAPTPVATTNGHVTVAEELNDTLKQINLNETETVELKLEETEKEPENLQIEKEPDLELISPPSPPRAVSPLESSPSAVPVPPPLPAIEYPSTSTTSSLNSHTSTLRPTTPVSSTEATKFVGLVNQAMTCYLNSLLQALYMTPEFRNAVYNWEFDGQDESKSIPYQLQRLFLNLQTSPKAAVETTDLTRSFGWDSSEAWQQHDIQELCRVMFDALEHKFKNTSEADLINRLYEGKMIDYLKCLSCGTEKQREDTFLDIPLPVKPFGSTVAFGSIEEALRAFIQPEILNGNNQYNCEKCAKKCDAHKGLKFSKFPYILTLHLKRFDFDYQTFHRIKLNDRVTFPQTLNLNGFVNVATEFETNGDGVVPNGGNGEVEVDLPATAEDFMASELKRQQNGHNVGDGENGEQMNGHPAGGGGGVDELDSQCKNNATTFGSHSGPYLYELFAISIHSGSASGGHYYVYIKDFVSGNWLCFNDQSVSPITQEDIQKSFGGSGGRHTYSSAYTTSTNAYMLMYRQLDPSRNLLPTPVEELPEHIRQLQKKLKDRQEIDQRRRTAVTTSSDYSVIATRVYHYDRERCTMSDVKIHISSDYYLDDLLQRSYDRMSLATLRSLNLCRLVAFDSRTQQTLASIESPETTLLQTVLDKYEGCDFLLEERDRDEKFREYTTAMVNARVYVVDMKGGCVDGPYRVPITLAGTVKEMKVEIKEAMRGLNRDTSEGVDLRVALVKLNFAVILENDKDALKHEIDPTELCPVKLFVAPFPESAHGRGEQFDRRLKRIAERFDRIRSVYFKVPIITEECRKLHAIPGYEEEEVKVEEVKEENKKLEIEIKNETEKKGEAEKVVLPPQVVIKSEEEELEKMDISTDSDKLEERKENGIATPTKEVPMEIDLVEKNNKQMSLTPEPPSSASELSLSSPSPEPPEVKPKPKTTVKVKSLKPKSSSGSVVTADGEKTEKEKAKEKPPGSTVRETIEWKEVVVNGVTKRIRVVKRIVKKDPTKSKVVVANGTVNGEGGGAGDQKKAGESSLAVPPSTNGTATTTATPTKVVKKVKVAAKSPAKEVVPEVAPKAVAVPKKEAGKVGKPVLTNNNNSNTNIDSNLKKVTKSEELVSVPSPSLPLPVAATETVTATATVVVEPPTPPPKVEEEPPVDLFAFLDDVEKENGASAGQYFRAMPRNKSVSEQNGTIADDETRLIQVHADRNMTISALKTFLEPVLRVSKDYFKINRTRTEAMSLYESVSSLADGDELLIELGRILQDGEYKYKISHLKLSTIGDYTEELPHVCDFVVAKMQSVEEVKRGILQYLAQNGQAAIGEQPPEKFRLWTKLYQSLGQVCMDNYILGEDFTLRRGGELVLQEIEEGIVDPMSDCDEFVIFARKWQPDTLCLEPYTSVTLPHKSELMQVLSEKSGIPVENLEYARNMLPFPKMKISKTSINADMDWKSEPKKTSLEDSRSGHVYFYRDKTLPQKELTVDEVAEISREETSKRDAAKAALNGGLTNGGGSGEGYSSTAGGGLDAGSSSSTAAATNRRKERGLKIYIDASPVKAIAS